MASEYPLRRSILVDHRKRTVDRPAHFDLRRHNGSLLVNSQIAAVLEVFRRWEALL